MTSDPVPDIVARNIILRQDFLSFLNATFNFLNPTASFYHNWHLELISYALSLVSTGEVLRLIINMPPRSLKSVAISVAWPAWIMGGDPSKRVICASYSQKISNKLSLDTRSVVVSDWFRQIFPELTIIPGQNEKAKFVTSQHGFRMATSVGGSLTGEGGDILILDDPHNPIHLLSPKMRNKTIDWFENSFVSRLNNKAKGAIIIVMQRLHNEDLTGHLLKKKNWEIMTIPSFADENIEVRFKNFHYFFGKDQVLNPHLDTMESLNHLRRDMGDFNFSSQYQQRPVGNLSGLIKLDWLRFYDKTITPEMVFISWDTAIKIGHNHDYSCATIWTIMNNKYYLLDLFRGKLEYPSLKKKIQELASLYPNNVILIEDQASGRSLIQEFRAELNMSVQAIKPFISKELRVASIAGLFESGLVMLPQNSPWLASLVEELIEFPNAPHDDQVDSISQFLNFYKSNQIRRAQIRSI